MRFSGIVSIALPDIILLGLYFMWVLNIVVLRTQRMPRLQHYDIAPLLLVTAYILSIPGSPEPKAALFGLYFLIQHVLIFFYLSRQLELRHFPLIIIAFCFTILPEAMLGMFQYITGKWLSLPTIRPWLLSKSPSS